MTMSSKDAVQSSSSIREQRRQFLCMIHQSPIISHHSWVPPAITIQRSHFHPSQRDKSSTKKDNRRMINVSVAYLKTIEEELASSGDGIIMASESPSSPSTSKPKTSKLSRSVRVSGSTSRKSKRKNKSKSNRFDQDEESCCFCPCWHVDNDDENKTDQQPHRSKRQRRRLLCNPVRCLQSWQSKLYQNPLFYRLSLQRQQHFPRSRRRTSDPTLEHQPQPSPSPVIIRSRSFFLKIRYKSLMMGMVLALIIVRCSNNNGGVDMLKNSGEPLYGVFVPVDESFQQRQSGDWQQMQQMYQQLPQTQVYYNNVERRDKEVIPLEVLQQRESAVDRIESYLRGAPPIPSDGVSTTNLALDSSIAINTAVELGQMQQEGGEDLRGHQSIPSEGASVLDSSISNVAMNTVELEQIQQQGGVDLRGHPPIPSEVAYTTGLVPDSSISNVVIKVVELEQKEQQAQVEGEEHKPNPQEMWDKAEEEITQHQQQLNSELAMQQEQLRREEEQQRQPQEQQRREQQPQEQPPPQPETYTVEFNNIKNTWDPHERNDIALLWHVPASGSSVIRHAVGGCHRLVQASGFGLRDGHDTDDQVGVFYPTEGSPFVNIDSTTIQGIRRAASMRFADAQVADVVVTPLIYGTNELFTHTSQGRFFAMFSHPVERAVRLFYSMKEVQPALREWTMDRYCRSTYVENNFLTRQLSNHLEGDLDESHYRKALEIIRDKFLVGLTSNMDESLERFEKYFRWTYRLHPESQESCRNRILLEDAAAEKKIKNRTPKEGDPNWAWLQHHNAFDLRLYAYIEKLFKEQAVFVKGATENFRNVDTTCCRCDPATFPAFELDGDDDDETPPEPDENIEQHDGGKDASTFQGGIRLLRRLPPELTSALFVPCTVDDFWLND